MSKMKKLAGLFLAMIMAFAMAAMTFAAEDTHKYDIYQIFTGDFTGNVLNNVKWGLNGTGTKDSLVDDATLDALTAVNKQTSDSAKLDVIKQYVKLNTTPYKEGVAAGKQEGLAQGYYLVKDHGAITGNDTATLYIVAVAGDGTLTIVRKADVPHVDKEILDPNATKINEASLGEKVPYEITGTLPSNYAEYKTYYYEFSDTLTKGLTYNKDLKVYIVNGTDKKEVATTDYEAVIGEYSNTDGTAIAVSFADLKKLNGYTINEDTKIVVAYSAVVNENAVIAGEGNPNKVKLIFSNDPNKKGDGKPGTSENPTGETPEDKVVTYVTELTILKHDQDGNILAGAEFTLASEDGAKIALVTETTFEKDAAGEYYKLQNGTFTKTAPTDATKDKYAGNDTYKKVTKVTKKGEALTPATIVGMVSPEDGTVKFTGLGAGNYTITETKTPDGYNTIAPISFKITFDKETKKFDADNGIAVQTDNTLMTTIVNKKGAELPSTGGIGTTIFYVLGAILLAFAAVLLITKKRMRAQ